MSGWDSPTIGNISWMVTNLQHQVSSH